MSMIDILEPEVKRKPMMKVYVFDLSWPYAGGMAVAVASTLTSAMLLVNELMAGESLKFYTNAKAYHDTDKSYVALLLKEIEAPTEIKEWAHVNYQYA